MALVKDQVKPRRTYLSQTTKVETVDDRPIWQIIAESGPEIPADERAAAPHDGARNFKHYLYGHPREEALGEA